MKKSFKNCKILKNDGHFRIPHPQISLKQFSNFCENVVYFLWLCTGVNKYYRIYAKQFIKKNLKIGSVGSFLTFWILKNWPTLLFSMYTVQ